MRKSTCDMSNCLARVGTISPSLLAGPSSALQIFDARCTKNHIHPVILSSMALVACQPVQSPLLVILIACMLRLISISTYPCPWPPPYCSILGYFLPAPHHPCVLLCSPPSLLTLVIQPLRPFLSCSHKYGSIDPLFLVCTSPSTSPLPLLFPSIWSIIPVLIIALVCLCLFSHLQSLFASLLLSRPPAVHLPCLPHRPRVLLCVLCITG